MALYQAIKIEPHRVPALNKLDVNKIIDWSEDLHNWFVVPEDGSDPFMLNSYSMRERFGVENEKPNSIVTVVQD